MLAWWQAWFAHFRPETCQGLIEAGLKIQPQPGVVRFGADAGVDEKIRRSTIRWVNSSNKDFQAIWARLHEMVIEANDNAFGFDIDEFSELQFTEYSAESGGYYRSHIDVDWLTRSQPAFRTHRQRKLSLVMQLSDPASYVGGDLILTEEPPATDQLRRRGTVIVFPSFMSHQVKPVTTGVRYSLVAWCNGPKWR